MPPYKFGPLHDHASLRGPSAVKTSALLKYLPLLPQSPFAVVVVVVVVATAVVVAVTRLITC